MADKCGGCSYCGKSSSLRRRRSSTSRRRRRSSAQRRRRSSSTRRRRSSPGKVVPGPNDGFKHSDWNNYYVANNPLGIKAKSRRSDNYFILLGDWGGGGCTSPTKNCQKMVAGMLRDYVKQQKTRGKQMLFIAALGDNFYGSVDGGKRFTSSWKDIYGTDLTSNYPWLSTLGNHDFDNGDKALGCPQGVRVHGQNYGGIQLNADKNNNRRPSFTKKYWQPDYNYHYSIPAVGLEVISVDMNEVGGGYIRAVCKDHLRKIKNSGYALLRWRGRVSKAKNVLIINHYPNQDKKLRQEFKSGGSRAKVLSAFGHAHSNWVNGESIQSGNGGGYRSGSEYGFVAVHLQEGSGWRTEIKNRRCTIERPTC